MSSFHSVEHGGPDDGPPIAWDFSTNANPLPAPAAVLKALAEAGRRHYPDPHYTALRAVLARHWGTDPALVLPTAGSSEGIRRMSLAASLQGVRDVWVPKPGYGDYRAAASALGLRVRAYGDTASLLQALRASAQPALLWLCEPCNPTGQSLPTSFWTELARTMATHDHLIVALDRAYEPLRLEGEDPVLRDVARQCWQLWSPNKALGLTGIRAGALQAPVHAAQTLLPAILNLAPSWVLSAEGVALWHAWCGETTQAWLAQSRATLLAWRGAQQHMLTAMGWQCQASVTPFFLARPCASAMSDTASRRAWLLPLRVEGIKLRDTTSMGLPGWLRLSTQPPEARRALQHALAQAVAGWKDAA